MYTERKVAGRMEWAIAPACNAAAPTLQARQRVSPSRGGKQVSVRHDKIELRFLAMVRGKPAVKKLNRLLKRGRNSVDTKGFIKTACRRPQLAEPK